jgi:hypothetical protein
MASTTLEIKKKEVTHLLSNFTSVRMNEAFSDFNLPLMML